MAMLLRLAGRRALLTRYASGGGVARAVAPLVAAKELPATSASFSVRAFGSKSDGGLLKVLKSEIEHEKGQNDEPKELKMKAPAPFTLHDKPGTQEIILRRSYGTEDIAVTCVFRLSPYDEPIEEEEDDEDADQPVSQEEVHMNVTIAKGGDSPVLEISCTCSQGEIDIEKVSYVASSSAKEDEMVYSGPEFTELDEDLQNQFKKYLEARGINDDLCTFLINFMPEKERKEYIRWLENVETFLRK